MKKIFLLLSLFISSCVSTNIASFTDPNGSKYGRVLVVANYSDFGSMKMIEGMLVDRLDDHGVFAVAMSTILPPIREYSDDEKRSAILRENIDSYLIITPAGSSSGTIYLPSISSTNANVTATDAGASVNANSYQSPGGSRNVLSSVSTTAELYEFSTHHVVWKAQAETNIGYNSFGQTTGDWTGICSSFCNNIVDDLRSNRLLERGK